MHKAEIIFQVCFCVDTVDKIYTVSVSHRFIADTKTHSAQPKKRRSIIHELNCTVDDRISGSKQTHTSQVDFLILSFGHIFLWLTSSCQVSFPGFGDLDWGAVIEFTLAAKDLFLQSEYGG